MLRDRLNHYVVKYVNRIALVPLILSARSASMDLTRRSFLGVTAGAAAASLQRTPVVDAGDPLGVRKDFPALATFTFLNTAYTGLISRAVVEAARNWTETRAGRTFTVGEMLAKTDEARRLYASLVG